MTDQSQMEEKEIPPGRKDFEGKGGKGMDWWALLAAIGVPSAITALCFGALERRMARREQLSEERERVRQKNEVLLVRSVGAAIALGEATATALKNGHANGETEAALAYARQVKHEQKDFLTEQGIRAIYDKEEGSSWTRF